MILWACDVFTVLPGGLLVFKMLFDTNYLRFSLNRLENLPSLFLKNLSLLLSFLLFLSFLSVSSLSPLSHEHNYLWELEDTLLLFWAGNDMFYFCSEALLMEQTSILPNCSTYGGLISQEAQLQLVGESSVLCGSEAQYPASPCRVLCGTVETGPFVSGVKPSLCWLAEA